MKLLTEKQLAEMVGVSVVTVQRWRRAGIGPEWCRAGKRYRYDYEEVEKWLRKKDDNQK